MTLHDEAARTGRAEGSHGDPVFDLGGARADEPIERHRARLAYAIHDGLTQVVTATVLELESLAHHAEIEPLDAVEALHRAVEVLRTALDEIRGTLTSLTPAEPSDVQPIEDLLRSVLERWHLPANWSVEGDLDEIPAPVLEAASSVIREGIANAAKHANPHEVAVRVYASNRSVEVSVEDDGMGFESSAAPVEGHLGLEMMRRRVADVHGTLDVDSAPGRGTRVVARLPVTEKE